MRKRIVAVLIIFVLLICVVIALLLPATIEYKTVVQAPFHNISSAVFQFERWRDWHPLAKNHDRNKIRILPDKDHPSIHIGNTSIQVKAVSSLGIFVEQQQEDKEILYSLLVIPLGNENACTVLLKKKGNFLQSFFQKLFPSLSQRNDLLAALKHYIETPVEYYGYPIHTGPVVDTIVLTLQTAFHKDSFFSRLPALYDQLNKFTWAKELTPTDRPILYINQLKTDSLLITAGLPVNKTTGESGVYSYMKMPNGRMLIGKYTGPYGGIQRLIKSMEQFIDDYSLKPVALPYQKFLQNRIPTSDSSMVEVEVYYPIF